MEDIKNMEEAVVVVEDMTKKEKEKIMEKIKVQNKYKRPKVKSFESLMLLL